MTDDQRDPYDVLVDYFDAWKEKDWKRMMDCCQFSWIDTFADPLEELMARHSFKLIEAKIENITPVNPVVVTGLVKIKYSLARGVNREVEVYPRLICERGPLFPDPYGKWGICPTSMVL
jgi:ketosteroid isomerase-like protein